MTTHTQPSAPRTTGLGAAQSSRAGTLLLVLGADPIGRQAAALAAGRPAVTLAFDRSGGMTRVVRLLRRRVLSPGLVARMAWAQWRRRSAPGARADHDLVDNAALARLIRSEHPVAVVLFRAGLIINEAVLGLGVPILNLHCARVPEDGGLGSIDRALRAGRFDQLACLHVVTESIDQGTVLASEPYRLEASRSYADNEDEAYRAGLRLLRRLLDDWTTRGALPTEPAPDALPGKQR